ncbi:transposable element Tcb2 transposase [Trichonephila clavipes]|nr:transposable element Tcb2 transposase [Trichonephila clavipes]
MEAEESARRVARQLGHYDCVMRRCWKQWIREMSFIRRPGSGHPRQISRREDPYIVRNASVQPTALSATIQAQVAPSLGVPVSSRTIQRRLAERYLGSRPLLRVLSLTLTHRRLRLEWCRARRNWTAGEWNQVIFSNESRFKLNSDDNRVSVWRPHVERLNPAFTLQRHIAPTAGVMVWGVIAYNTRSPLVLIRGTMIAQWYVHDILQLHVLPLMQRLPGAIFLQDNARPHREKVSQDCISTVTILPWSAISPDLSPINHIWDHLGLRVWRPTNFERTRGKVTTNMEQNVS